MRRTAYYPLVLCTLLFLDVPLRAADSWKEATVLPASPTLKLKVEKNKCNESVAQSHGPQPFKRLMARG